MPTADRLTSLEIDLSNGYFPSAPDLSPEGLQRTIRAGSNVWLRPRGKIEVANGLDEVSSTNVGARIFASDIQRVTIEGGLVGDRLPYAGFLRYEHACLFFLSEETEAQLYIDETLVTDLITSSTAGRLRVAVPNGAGGYDTFDAGFEKPIISVFALNPGLGVKDMKGAIGISICRWRSKTLAVGPPADTIYSNIAPNTNTTIGIELPSSVAGQDGWVAAGTKWGDRSGTLRILRYVYNRPRGTFTATNGSPNLTAGVGTHWTLDLQRGDVVVIDGLVNQVSDITSDTTVTLVANFTGTTNPDKVMDITIINNEWYDGELRGLVSRDAQAPPSAAGVLQYGGRVFIWGIADPDSSGSSTAATGNVLAAMLDDNPEHVSLVRARTASGSDLVNVLAGDGPMYLMTTTSLEVISFKGNTGPNESPYVIRVIAEPGFKASTNGILYKDWFYGFTNKPLRTRAENNIDVQFGSPVESDMRDWNAERVMLAVDPENEAVLYMFDDGSTTVVLPWMTQQELWGPPLNFTDRIIDSAVVGGNLYVTYLSGGNYRVQQWEGGSGIGGTRYVASQYYDPDTLNTGRIKSLIPVGKLGSLSVYTATADAAVPDVSDLAQAAATFTLSDTASKREPAIKTNIRSDATAFRLDFASNDGTFDKLIVRGRPVGEDR